MMSKYLIIIIFFTSSSFLFAKNTVITGSAPAFTGMTVRLTSYKDYISDKEYMIASAKIDKSGNFSLAFDISTTTYAFLNLDFRRSEIYLIPGSSYDLKIKSPAGKQKNVNPFLAETILEFEIMKAADDDINLLIYDLNVQYNTFIADKNNFNALYRKRDKSRIDTFKNQVSQHFPDITNLYFRNFVKYKIASLEYLARITSKKNLFDKYFIDKPILYNHVEYMDFFNQFFNNYIISSPQIKYNDLIVAVEQKQDYFSLLDYLGKDTLLRNEVLREMVMLRGLKDMFNKAEFTKSKIIKILDDFSVKSKFEKHRDIAKNLVSMMNKLQPGTEAPAFSLKDMEGDTVYLEDFSGKYVYLCFWTSWCVPCIKEFEALSKIYSEYNNDIEFLGISVDKEYSSMYHFLNEKKYPWANFHYDNDIDLIEDYEIKTYPLFVLIDRKGKIIRYPAPSPSQNIEMIFGKLLFDESRR